MPANRDFSKGVITFAALKQDHRDGGPEAAERGRS